MAAARRVGAVNATGPAGMTTLGGLLDALPRGHRRRRGVGAGARRRSCSPPASRSGCTCRCGCRQDVARTAWDVDTTRARELGLPSRPLRETVADTWAWLQADERPPLPPGRPEPGLPPELEATLLAAHVDQGP